jgi:hypothetical protein
MSTNEQRKGWDSLGNTKRSLRLTDEIVMWFIAARREEKRRGNMATIAGGLTNYCSQGSGNVKHIIPMQMVA